MQIFVNLNNVFKISKKTSFFLLIRIKCRLPSVWLLSVNYEIKEKGRVVLQVACRLQTKKVTSFNSMVQVCRKVRQDIIIKSIKYQFSFCAVLHEPILSFTKKSFLSLKYNVEFIPYSL